VKLHRVKPKYSGHKTYFPVLHFHYLCGGFELTLDLSTTRECTSMGSAS